MAEIKKDGFCKKCGTMRMITSIGILCPRCDKVKYLELKKEQKRSEKKKVEKKESKRAWKRSDIQGMLVGWKHKSGVSFCLMCETNGDDNGGKSSYRQILMKEKTKKLLDVFTRKKLAVRDMRKKVSSEELTSKLLDIVK